MNNEYNHIDDLLARYFSGEATAQEGVEVGSWLAESESNRAYFKQYQVLWKQAGRSKSFEPDVDAAWNKVKLRTVSKAKLTVSKRPEKSEKAFFRQLSIAASIILIAGVGFVAYRTFREPAAQNITLSATTHTISATLPDSSTVLLNAHSKLLYPETFKRKSREVTLIGKAFFDIRKQPEKPFIIHAGKTEITVLGTSFTINTITDSITEVIVKTGVVQFSTPRGMHVLRPGMKAIYYDKKGELKHELVRIDNMLSAETGVLSFNNTKLSDVVADVNRHYGCNIILESPSIANCTLTTDFKKETLDNTLTIIATTLNLQINRQSDRIVLSGQSCN